MEKEILYLIGGSGFIGNILNSFKNTHLNIL